MLGFSLQTATRFREILSGRRQGLWPGLLRALLRAAGALYGLGVRWRNRRYDRDRGGTLVHRVSAPVVSVGNLTVGGTGKTPMVAWLARWFRRAGVRVTLISRGYGAEEGARNDEALELEQKLPDVPHMQNPDRVEAARVAIEEFECQLILLDDAFQHRRIFRDLDIVLIDALAPFGYGYLLPRGLLREPPASLSRAHVVALTRADTLDRDARRNIQQRVLRLAPQADWLEIVHQPRVLLDSAGAEQDIRSLAGQPVVAFCGIGNPDGFRHSLRHAGLELLELREFPDHYNYEQRDLDQLAEWAGSFPQATAVITTHKDLVKIAVPRLGDHPLWALAIEMEIVAGQELLEEKLRQLVQRATTVGRE